MQYRVEQARCNNITFNESHLQITQQMDIMYKYLRQEVNEAQIELNILIHVAESFFPPQSSLGTTRRRRSIDEVEPHNRTRRLIGAVAALAAGTVSVLGEPIKDAASNVHFSFNLCDSTEVLEGELDQVTKQEKTQQRAFQTIQDQNNKELAVFREEIRLAGESVEKVKEDAYTHISYMLEHIYTHWKMRSDVINSKVPIATFFTLRHFSHHKLAHCTYTLKLFVPHFTLIEITFSR